MPAETAQVKKPWTTAEDKIVREHYPHASPAALEALLPGRTYSAISGHVKYHYPDLKRRVRQRSVDRILALYRQGVNPMAIAIRVQRTHAHVLTTLRRHGRRRPVCTRRRWTGEEKARALAWHEAGLSNAAIAARLGRSEKAIGMFVINNTPRKKAPVTVLSARQQRQLIVDYREGRSLEAIARRLGVSRNVVVYRLPELVPGQQRRCRPWTEAEDITLLAHRADGYSWEDIAEILGRGPRGVRARHSALRAREAEC